MERADCGTWGVVVVSCDSLPFQSLQFRGTGIVSQPGVLCSSGGVLDDGAHRRPQPFNVGDLLEVKVLLRIEASIQQNEFSALVAFTPAFRLPPGLGVYWKPDRCNQEHEFIRRVTLLALRCLRAARTL